MRGLTTDRQRDLQALGLIALVVLAWLWPVTIGGRLLSPADMLMVMQPWKAHAREVGFQRVQTLWDEAMAETVVGHLFTCLDGSRRMVVLAGGHHIRYGFGIPRRVFRRLPTSYALVGSREVVVPKEKDDRYMDVEVPGFPMIPYHYLVAIAYESLPNDKVKLGVRMEEEDGKVVVKEVVPTAAADKAGVLAGDILLALDGEAIKNNFDLIYAVGQKAKGDKGMLEVERDGSRLALEVEFQPIHAEHPIRLLAGLAFTTGVLGLIGLEAA